MIERNVNPNTRFVISYYSTGGSTGYKNVKIKYKICPNFVKTETDAMHYWIHFDSITKGDLFGRRFIEIIKPNAIRKIVA